MKKYRIVEVDWDKKHEKAEGLMNEMSEKGWDVVCVTAAHPSSIKQMITFCRDE